MSKDWYSKRLGWLNVDKKPAIKGDGKVHKFMTKNNKPVMVPDDNPYNDPVEPIPSNVEAVPMYEEAWLEKRYG